VELIVIEPDTSDTPARLAFVIGRFNRRLLGATGGLSQGLLSALATVDKVGPIRLADLSALEQVSAPTITRTIAELEARGLVDRSADPVDGRASLIAVTEAGLDAIRRARAARAEVVSELLTRLDEVDRAAVRSAMPAFERMLEA
jgi:DNA-binding MarR family transcriptional regulator